MDGKAAPVQQHWNMLKHDGHDKHTETHEMKLYVLLSHHKLS